jgi:polyhydroxybutyrate depolymerase
VNRTYQLTLPSNYSGRTPLPIVFALHALTVSYAAAPVIAGFGDIAQRYAFIGVAPSGLLNGSTPYWLAAPVTPNHDVRFISDLLDSLERNLCVDRSRVYSTGQSNGAQMSSLLACQLSNRITAVAPVAGAEFYDSCHGRPVPVMAFHGTADPFVKYDGGGLDSETIATQNLWKGTPPAGLPVHHGVEAAMRAWAAHNGCDPKPVDRRIGREVRVRTWRHCKAETVLYTIEGGGHTWPGHPVPGFEKTFGPTTMEIDATALMFHFFFSQHS